VIVTMSMVYRHMHDVEQKALKYAIPIYRKTQVKCWKRSRRVMVQGLLYTAVLVFIYLFFLVGVLLKVLADKYVVIIINITALFLLPLQGFFNALIYSIPTFQRLRKRLEKKRKENKMKRGLNRSDTNKTSLNSFYASTRHRNSDRKDVKMDLNPEKQDSTNDAEKEVSSKLERVSSEEEKIISWREEVNTEEEQIISWREEVSTEEEQASHEEKEEEDIISSAAADRRNHLRESYRNSVQECVYDLDFPSSNPVDEESSTVDQPGKKSSGTIFYSLDDDLSDDDSECNDDDNDDYLSLRFFTENQRQQSSLKFLCASDNSHSLFEECSNRSNSHFPIANPHLDASIL